MSLAGLWQAGFWPVRTAISVWWAMANTRDRSPVPAARTVDEVAQGATVLSAHYKPDPFNGLLDMSLDPRQVQYHLERGTLGLLPSLDCDDLAYWAVARMRAIAKAHVLILTDETGKYSHAVCEAFLLDGGTHIVIDTNGCHRMAGWASVSALFKSIYPEARYTDEMRVAYDFGDPGRL